MGKIMEKKRKILMIIKIKLESYALILKNGLKTKLGEREIKIKILYSIVKAGTYSINYFNNYLISIN